MLHYHKVKGGEEYGYEIRIYWYRVYGYSYD
jgi:hypothetical protein